MIQSRRTVHLRIGKQATKQLTKLKFHAESKRRVSRWHHFRRLCQKHKRAAKVPTFALNAKPYISSQFFNLPDYFCPFFLTGKGFSNFRVFQTWWEPQPVFEMSAAEWQQDNCIMIAHWAAMLSGEVRQNHLMNVTSLVSKQIQDKAKLFCLRSSATEKKSPGDQCGTSKKFGTCTEVKLFLWRQSRLMVKNPTRNCGFHPKEIASKQQITKVRQARNVSLPKATRQAKEAHLLPAIA